MCAHKQRDPFKNYDAWKTRTPWDNEREHGAGCPAGEDGPKLYSECGGLGQCMCHPPTIRGWMSKWYYRAKFGEEVCVVVKDPECICPSEGEIACEKAEYLRDTQEDR